MIEVLKNLEKLFNKNNFSEIESAEFGLRFLLLKSLSRKDIMLNLAKFANFDISSIKSKDYLYSLFCYDTLSNQDIIDFIKEYYFLERRERILNQDYLIDQLSRLQVFDWGGSFGNSLEKNIVNNYVKKIQSYDKINEEIESSLLLSLRGYTLNSWYNHWTSILIEDIFKDHSRVIPTIGLIKKVDFFIDCIPFDLKVTYFPEELLAEKLKEVGFGVELTRLKSICRELNIFIPNDLKDKALKFHLHNKLSESTRVEAIQFLQNLNSLKKKIVSEAQQNPIELKRWLYENQGEARFDASNRFFLILVDENNLSESWKLKRNIYTMSNFINSHLNDFDVNAEHLYTEFYWKPDDKIYNCKSDILFIKI